jgi:hypothetical protein
VVVDVFDPAALSREVAAVRAPRLPIADAIKAGIEAFVPALRAVQLRRTTKVFLDSKRRRR